MPAHHLQVSLTALLALLLCCCAALCSAAASDLSGGGGNSREAKLQWAAAGATSRRQLSDSSPSPPPPPSTRHRGGRGKKKGVKLRGGKVKLSPDDLTAARNGSRYANHRAWRATAVEMARQDAGARVVGKDNRVFVTNPDADPWVRIGELVFCEGACTSSDYFACTGAMISRYYVLTAGHCVFDLDNGKYSKQHVFYPAYQNAATPYGSYPSNKLYAPPGFRGHSNYDIAIQWDYGLVQLQKPLGDQVGWFGWGYFGGQQKNLHIAMAGYPSDKPDDTMWASTCTLSVNLNQPNFYHTCDEASGNSGSPMFVNIKKSTHSIPAGYYIIGIDVAETPDPAEAAHPNIGTSLSPSVLTDIYNHVAAEPKGTTAQSKKTKTKAKKKAGR